MEVFVLRKHGDNKQTSLPDLPGHRCTQGSAPWPSRTPSRRTGRDWVLRAAAEPSPSWAPRGSGASIQWPPTRRHAPEPCNNTSPEPLIIPLPLSVAAHPDVFSDVALGQAKLVSLNKTIVAGLSRYRAVKRNASPRTGIAVRRGIFLMVQSSSECLWSGTGDDSVTTFGHFWPHGY